MDYNKKAIQLHEKYRGKIEIKAKVPLATKEDLSAAYTPGVGAVCLEIKDRPERSWELTNRRNMVAIVSDGSAILGLGNIGPAAGMPVMEGKSAIFKEFADIDAVPLCINTQDTEEIIRFVRQIEPSFGGINLEDISAPRCFEILRRLEAELSIPVFHDDQDGTAIVTLAALINAAKVAGKNIPDMKIVINGAGAAGLAIARLLLEFGANDLYVADSQGLIYEGRRELNIYKQEIAKRTNRAILKGWKEDAMKGADVFIGVSKSKQVTGDMIRSMNKGAILLPMANPEPEIFPDQAYAVGAAIVGTGRSDFPNQVNNALVFPGVFRGLLDEGLKKVTNEMKLAAAEAIASLVPSPTKDEIVPIVTNRQVVTNIAEAVKNNA